MAARPGEVPGPTTATRRLTVISIEREKQVAAEAAAELVENGMTVGLGTGSTVAYLLPALARRSLRIVCAATSPRTEHAARELGLKIEDVTSIDRFDITIDGADQIAPDGWLVKGGGGAHTREKIVAGAADRFVVIADSSKPVPALHAPVPLELMAFGLRATMRRIGAASLRDVPMSPDGGVIADYHGPVDDPAALAAWLSSTPGLVGHGLFPPQMVATVLIGRGESAERIDFTHDAAAETNAEVIARIARDRGLRLALQVTWPDPRENRWHYEIGGPSVWNVTDAAGLVPFDEESYYQDPLGFFAGLRESRPVAPVQMPGYGRAWIVTRYDDVRTVLTDPRLAKDVHRWPGGPRSRPSEATGVYAHMLHADPPDHTRLRRLVQKAFTPRRAALRPRAEQIAADLLNELAAERSDVIDLLDAYARPLPIAVVCELLGMPVADRDWIRATVTAYDNRTEHQRVERELAAYFTELIAAKRAEPGDDLVSALVLASDRAGADGDADGLTGAELVSAAFLLVMAGFDTTINLIASGTLALLTHPGEAARLRQDPSLLPAAVEELLRFTNPVNHANDRFTTEDVRIGGVVIPAGEWVFPVISSADRDPARFPDPDRLDLGRDTSGHVAFGHGVHHCLGAPLARMEAEVAIGTLLARFPGLSLAVPPEELRWRPVSLMNGLESLPVRLA